MYIGVRRTLLKRKVASSYTGPGDINGAALAWYGLRAFNAAYATGSNAALDLVDQAGANPITINILANGNLDVASINTWVTAHTVTTIKITKVYDQSGNSRHLIQATLANMPTLALNTLGSLPAMSFNGSTFKLQSSVAAPTQAQPFTMSAVYDRTGNTADFGTVLTTFTNPNGILLPVAANQAGTFFGSTGATATATDSSWHAFQATANGASTNYYVDGSSSTPSSPGTNGWTNTDTMAMGAEASGARFLAGFIGEAGAWGSDKSANNSSMNSNQHTYWGF